MPSARGRRFSLATDNKEPVPTWVSPSGHGFACRSQMVEGSRRRANLLDFVIHTDFTRDSKGRRLVSPRPFSPTEGRVDQGQWWATVSSMSSSDLARELGITDRHARRIKSGKVTKDRLAKWAEERPTLAEANG